MFSSCEESLSCAVCIFSSFHFVFESARKTVQTMTTARIDLENVCSKLEMKGPQYSIFVTEVQEILQEIVKFPKTVQCLQVKVAAIKPDEVGFFIL